jgi:hypothetical protein
LLVEELATGVPTMGVVIGAEMGGVDGGTGAVGPVGDGELGEIGVTGWVEGPTI